MLRIPRGTKFEPRVLESVYVETLEHGVHQVLVTSKDSTPRLVKCRHVTFDEFSFPCAHDLTVEDEVASDDDSGGGEVSESSDTDSVDSISAEDFDGASALVIKAQNNDGGGPPGRESNGDNGSSDAYFSNALDNDSNDGNNDSENEKGYDTAREIDIIMEVTGDSVPVEPRYPHRQRCPPKDWSMFSDTFSSPVNVTTGDEPTLRKTLYCTLEERDMCLSAIHDEISSLNRKDTCVLHENPESQLLPTHVILKVKRSSSGNVETFKSCIVAGRSHQTYGEDFIETYAPVVSFTLVLTFLFLTLCFGNRVAHLDVKTAFLNRMRNDSAWVMSL